MKEHTDAHTGCFVFFIFDSRQYAVSQLEGNIASLDPTPHRAKKERERECTCVSKSQWLCCLMPSTWLTRFKRPQTALDQIQSGPTQPVILLRAAIHNTSYSFTGHDHKCRRAEPNKLYISLTDLQRYTYGRDSKQWNRGCHGQKLKYSSETHRFVGFPRLAISAPLPSLRSTLFVR